MFCKPDTMNIGKFLVEKNVINDAPPYQRESGIWPLDKKQLFLDSLLNEFDVPKIYLHDLSSQGGRFTYAIIDGKQRISTIWEFLDGALPLAKDFELYNVKRAKKYPIKAGSTYEEFLPWWKETFKNIGLSITFVHEADDEDIEELFSRLNNGEPLSAAEKRNAKAGDMVSLIRDVAGLPFFTNQVSFGNKRLQHHEVAAKFLLIEHTQESSGDPFCDLKKTFLDRMVERNRKLQDRVRATLKDNVATSLKSLGRLFSRKDPLLSKQAYPPLYYLFTKVMDRDYAAKDLVSQMKAFLEAFQLMRAENLKKKEDADPVLLEFGRLMQQGTNDIESLRNRVAILKRFFLLRHPGTPIRDPKRTFTPEERAVIWLMAGKQCAKCKKALASVDEMHADHQRQWAHGGPTTLENGRCLCESCNQEEKE